MHLIEPTPPFHYTLSLHDALPILDRQMQGFQTLLLDLLHQRDTGVDRGKDGNQHVRLIAPQLRELDRKSTRLNSSHVAISYAVFCLKKKIYSRSRRCN